MTEHIIFSKNILPALHFNNCQIIQLTLLRSWCSFYIELLGHLNKKH